MSLPPKQGLYDPLNEHDSCGVGFVANIKGQKSHQIVGQGLQLLINLDHRGAVGADPLVGDGAGILIQIPDALLRDWAKDTGITLRAGHRLRLETPGGGGWGDPRERSGAAIARDIALGYVSAEPAR